jgi:hypothetical protein
MPSVTLEKTMLHYAAVGRVASKWAQLEHHIQELIWGLAGLDEMTGTCITSQIGQSGRLMDAVLALLEQKGASKDDLKPFGKFCQASATSRECGTGSFTIPGIFISTKMDRLRAIGSNPAPSKPSSES